MPEYKAQIISRQLHRNPEDLPRLAKWLSDNDGKAVTETLQVNGEYTSCPKSNRQLGYYWALLLPEITKQLIADGHTYTVQFGQFKKEYPYDEPHAHELITALCGYVGKNGTHNRLSKVDYQKCRLWLDHVIRFAVDELRMKEEELQARRPK